MQMDRRGFVSRLVALAGGALIPERVHAAAMSDPDPMAEWKRKAKALREATVAAFPYETIRVKGKDALAEWERLKTVGRGYPVVLGGQEEFERVAGQYQSVFVDQGLTVAGELAKAKTYRFPEDFRARQAELRERVEAMRKDPKFADAMDSFLKNMDASVSDEPRRGPWPGAAPEVVPLSLASKFSFEGNLMKHRPRDECVIAMFPTTDWTEVFALAGFGGWNACPYPHENVAVFRYWRERYGLELAGMSGDVLDLRAARRPKDRDEAIALAREQYEICPDLVDQGDSLDFLAASLMTGDWWYFWWD